MDCPIAFQCHASHLSAGEQLEHWKDNHKLCTVTSNIQSMLVTSSRKRRRKPCSCLQASSTLAVLALLCSLGLAGGVRGKEQAFETVPVTRYSSGDSASQHGQHGRVDSGSYSNSTSPGGRYGHAAVYQQYTNKILFIGGQIGTTGTFVTNDVLSLDLSKPYSPFSTVSGFTETTNPALVPSLSVGLPPNAWSAYAVDAQERIWLVGGVTQDCESDAVAYVLQNASDWTPVELGNYRPPRRRQARAISVNNGTEDSNLYIFGGIAEPYTCSLETVGYLAIDIWNTTTTDAAPSVQSISWEAPEAPLHLDRPGGIQEPALSDYAAVSLPGEKAILFIGGQDASGKLAPMDEVLLFNTSTAEWSRQVSSTPRVLVLNPLYESMS